MQKVFSSMVEQDMVMLHDVRFHIDNENSNNT